jgi:GAF domain-containing protein
MNNSEMPVNEKQRIEILKKYDILDTPADGNFDRITRLASSIFNVPVAIISLVDSDRIWFKSHHGLPVNQIGREPGLCASAILSEDTYIVENAIEDVRTLANPLVAGEFGLRFYAAAPLRTDESCNLGTLCIIDKTPRTFSEKEKELLQQLAAIVMDEMEMRLVLRNTVHKIKTLTSDISLHLKRTINDIKALPVDNQSTPLVAYLDASSMFMTNVENQLNHL